MAMFHRPGKPVPKPGWGGNFVSEKAGFRSGVTLNLQF
jgi:hypothetical protein